MSGEYDDCEHCGRELKEGRAVWMELNCYTGMFAGPNDQSWPDEESQGCFPFGKACASTVLLRQKETGKCVPMWAERQP